MKKMNLTQKEIEIIKDWWYGTRSRKITIEEVDLLQKLENIVKELNKPAPVLPQKILKFKARKLLNPADSILIEMLLDLKKKQDEIIDVINDMKGVK